MYQIEDNIPVPQDGWRLGVEPKYPWRELQVGQSFFAALDKADINPDEDPQTTIYRLVKAAAYGMTRRQIARGEKPMRFRVAKEKHGVRCWRIA